MRRRLTVRQMGPWYAVAAYLLMPLSRAFSRREWRGLEHVPAAGGVVLAANHISHVDPVALADYVVFGSGRAARFMAKDTLFRGRGPVARIMRGAGQIPVHRRAEDASLALADAVAALQAGECVVIYPEGTVSRDPDKWPMLARTGVARLALLSGAPVVPVGQWGAQEVLDSYRRPGLHLLPRHPVRLLAGPPVDLSRWRGSAPTAEVLRKATDDVMTAVTALVAELRGAAPPDTAPYDARTTGSGAGAA